VGRIRAGLQKRKRLKAVFCSSLRKFTEGMNERRAQEGDGAGGAIIDQDRKEAGLEREGYTVVSQLKLTTAILKLDTCSARGERSGTRVEKSSPKGSFVCWY